MKKPLLLLIVLLAACGEGLTLENSVDEAEAGLPELTETERLTVWLDQQFKQQLDFSPQMRSVLGQKTGYYQLDNATLEAEQKILDWQRHSVASMHNDFDYANLTEDGKLSWDMWEYALQQAEAAFPYRQYRYFFGRGGPHASLPSFMISFHPIESVGDLQAYIARLREIDRVLAELLERTRQQAEQGIRPPRFSYRYALTEIGQVTSGVPFNTSDESPNSPIWSDLQTKVGNLVQSGLLNDDEAQVYLEEAREVLAGEVMVAYQEIRQWLELDINNTTSEPQGVWALPNGDGYYRQRLSQMTTLELTADEIHNIGLDEVERLLAEMEAVKKSTGFAGTLQEFFVFVRQDKVTSQ